MQKILAVAVMLLLFFSLSACEQPKLVEPDPGPQLVAAWTAIQRALDGGDEAALTQAFYPAALAESPNAVPAMLKVRKSELLNFVVLGKVRAVIADPPVALVSTSLESLVDEPTDWIFYRTPQGWKLVGNREAVNLGNLAAGKQPILVKDSEP